MSNEKELIKSLSSIEDIESLPQAHLVIVDGKSVILPYTVDTVIGTKNQTSSLDDDLRGIDEHIAGVLSGGILVGHSAKADKLTNPHKIALSGGASGEVSFDGSKNVTIPVVVSDNSHKHKISNVTGLQEALNEKLSVSHQHKEWLSFKSFSAGNYNVSATTVEDTLNLIAGKNILIHTNQQEKSITIDAVMKDVEAAVATTLRGIKIQFDANRTQNEQYIPVVSYSLPLEIGPHIDFHLSESAKDFDGRLLINPAGSLNYTIDGRETYRIFHEGNDGPNSGLDADTLDGKHASAFSLNDHHHDNRYLAGVNGEPTSDLTLANGKFLKGRKTDKSIHQLIGISGGNAVTLGSSTLPMTIWSNGNPCVGAGSNRHAIYHAGNKPSWLRDITNIPSTFPPSDHHHSLQEITNLPSTFPPSAHKHPLQDITNLPSTFPPSTHQHPSSEITDATPNNVPNTIVKRDGSGNFVTNLLTSNSVTTSGVTLSHSGVNRFVTGDPSNGWMAFHTGSSSIADALRLNKDGTAVFGHGVTIGGSTTLEGDVNLLRALTTKGWSTFLQGVTVHGGSEFKSGLTVHGGGDFKNDLTVRGHLWASRLSTPTLSTDNLSVAQGLTLQGGGDFKTDLTVRGYLWASRLSSPNLSASVLSTDTLSVSQGITVHGGSEFKSNLFVRGALNASTLSTGSLSASTISASSVDMGNYLKLNTGADGTGFDNRNNANIDTWFGFSVSNLCSGQSIGVGKPAFSVNARNGNTYAAGNFYADKTKRVYHEGNFHFSTSNTPSGGSNGDLWFTYEA